MHLLLFIATPLCLAAPAFSNSFANAAAEVQQPIAPHRECTTRTKVVTATSYEVNVVSTVYRYRTHATPTPEKQTLRFGVEGTGCDMMACRICRMMNNCSNEEENWWVKLMFAFLFSIVTDGLDSTGCDLAYYCNQCLPPRREFEAIPDGFRIRETCSAPDGRSIPCGEVEEAVADWQKASGADI